MIRRLVFFAVLMATPLFSFAFVNPPNPLTGVKVPATPGLLNGARPIVEDKVAAIQLGKALFWDVNVGSDGMACASCHYHAGADSRARNQLNPGNLHKNSSESTRFSITASGDPGGPDYQLKLSDFPFYRFANPANNQSELIYQTDDVVGSAGAFLRQFETTSSNGDTIDGCSPVNDSIFHLDAQNSRQVTPRNAPSVINAAFNYRNFWDGRANNQFNGVSAFGPRDPNAGIWVLQNGKTIKKRILLDNASLASLAVAPPLNDVEMSCVGRHFQALAKKLLKRRPLENQDIHPDDSVLGQLRHASGKGLNASYQALIKRAFAKRFWAGRGDFGIATVSEYPQMEANFPFFFGLALQLYQATLISDQTPFDGKRDPKTNYPVNFTASQKRGLELFITAECVACHAGPTLTAAAHPEVVRGKKLANKRLVNRSAMFEELDGFGVARSLIDVGYMVTSVAPADQDPGLGGKDPFGNPLSFAEQYVASLADPNRPIVDAIKVVACELSEQFKAPFFTSSEVIADPNAKACRGDKRLAKVPSPEVVKAELNKPLQGRMMTSVLGAFKIPGLRNIELTGPYMHNGSMKSLQEVIEFYDRGGNNVHNPKHIATLVFPQGFTSQEKADLLAFLQTLTDERVRWEKAPFDHPSLPLLNGHDNGSAALGPEFAADRIEQLPAVGKLGRTNLGPLQSFEYYLQP